MKPAIIFPSALLLILLSCGQQKTNEKKVIHDSIPQTKDEKAPSNDAGPKTAAPSANTGDRNLLGEWTCVLVTGDANTNGQLDEEEKKAGFNTYKDYLNLNADGSCLYTIAHLPGQYELIVKEGHQSIEVISPDGSRIKYGRIISLKPNELQLMKFSGGRDILVYTRP